MIDTSNISANEFVSILEPMLEPLHTISQLCSRRTFCEMQINDVRKNAGKNVNSTIKMTMIVSVIVLILIFTLIWNPHNAGIPIIVVVLVAEGVGLKLLYNIKLIPEKIKATEEQCNKEIADCNNEINRIIGTIPNIEYVPTQYLYFNAVSSISSYFKSGRANNWKEAVNLYEEELHRNKMQNLAELQAEAAINAEAYAKRTATESRKANSQIKNIANQVNNLSNQVSNIDSKIRR